MTSHCRYTTKEIYFYKLLHFFASSELRWLLMTFFICINTLFCGYFFKNILMEPSFSLWEGDVPTSLDLSNGTGENTRNRLNARLKRIRSVCQDLRDTHPLQTFLLQKHEKPWMYLSNRYRLLYCQIPKVGSTHWLELFARLEGLEHWSKKKRSIHAIPLKLLSYAKPRTQKHMMRNYQKFMVIREPFERILSAFRDKFIPKNGQLAPIYYFLSKKIVSKYRSPTSENKSQFATFQEFIAYITDTNSSIVAHYSQPRHWMPQTTLCRPCNVDYNYVINLELANEESDYVLKKFGLTLEYRYPKLDPARHGHPYKEVMRQFFEKVDRRYLLALYRYYEKDYKILGFDLPIFV